jgi:hypothetical protein
VLTAAEAAEWAELRRAARVAEPPTVSREDVERLLEGLLEAIPRGAGLEADHELLYALGALEVVGALPREEIEAWRERSVERVLDPDAYAEHRRARALWSLRLDDLRRVIAGPAPLGAEGVVVTSVELYDCAVRVLWQTLWELSSDPSRRGPPPEPIRGLADDRSTPYEVRPGSGGTGGRQGWWSAATLAAPAPPPEATRLFLDVGGRQAVVVDLVGEVLR